MQLSVDDMCYEFRRNNVIRGCIMHIILFINPNMYLLSRDIVLAQSKLCAYFPYVQFSVCANFGTMIKSYSLVNQPGWFEHEETIKAAFSLIKASELCTKCRGIRFLLEWVGDKWALLFVMASFKEWAILSRDWSALAHDTVHSQPMIFSVSQAWQPRTSIQCKLFESQLRSWCF